MDIEYNRSSICRIVVNGFFMLTLRISIPESDMSGFVFLSKQFFCQNWYTCTLTLNLFAHTTFFHTTTPEE